MNFAKSDPFYEYWIGKDVDYSTIWNVYESGDGYIQKFQSSSAHMIRITLREPARQHPLFNFEAVYKTIKGYFHDIKKLCMTSSEYDVAGPLFIYRVDRSSGIWEFLGELRQLLMLGTSLADEKVMGEKPANIDKRLEFIRKHFGEAVAQKDFEMFMKAQTPRQLEQAVHKLFEQGVQKVEISREPFTGDLHTTEATLVDLKLLPETTGGRSS